jgi:hypothetical protein
MDDNEIISLSAADFGVTDEEFIGMMSFMACTDEFQKGADPVLMGAVQSLRRQLASPEELITRAELEARDVVSQGSDAVEATEEAPLVDALKQGAEGILQLGDTIRQELKRFERSVPDEEMLVSMKLLVVLGISFGQMCRQLGITLGFPKLFELALEGQQSRRGRTAGAVQAYGSVEERDRVYEIWRGMWIEMRPTGGTDESTLKNISVRCANQGIVNKISGKAFPTRTIRRVVLGQNHAESC